MKFDVIIIGAGIAGLGSAVHLSKLGLKVACIEPNPFPHDKVGESLDWSTPGLLAELGITREQLVNDRVATYKEKLTFTVPNEKTFVGWIPKFFGKKPIEFEVTTLHADRTVLDQRVFERANQLGTQFFWTRVTEIEVTNKKVKNVRTSDGQTFFADWYIDASGQTRLFARKFNIPSQKYGKRKVALWTHLDNKNAAKGTNLFAENSPGYLSWVWEIPITPTARSVGLVVSADKFKGLLKTAQSVEKVFLNELLKFRHFQETLPENPKLKISRCSYQSYVHEYACGPNWFMVGEAASLPDPVTSNGVTAALRHAREAAYCIQVANRTGDIPSQQCDFFNTNLTRMGHIINDSIEKNVYEDQVRREIRMHHALYFYTLGIATLNALYTKYNPRTPNAIKFFGFLILGVRLWINLWGWIGKSLSRLRQSLAG